MIFVWMNCLRVKLCLASSCYLRIVFLLSGDQPIAISKLSYGALENSGCQTLLGVTGSGKTFTIANVIADVNKNTLIISHNKTLGNSAFIPN